MSAQEEINKAIEYAEKWDIQATFEEALTNLLVAHPNDPMGFLYDQIVTKAAPPTIEKIFGREILDSKGIPTLEVEVWGQVYGKSSFLSIASVPSCDFCSSEDSFILQDSSNSRYLGKGVRQSVSIVTSALQPALQHRQFLDQSDIDSIILSTDGTPNRRKIGSNTTLAVSVSIAIAASKVLRIPLYKHLSKVLTKKNSFNIPKPIITFFSVSTGPVSKVYLIPTSNLPFEEQIRIVGEVYLHYSSSLKASICSDGSFPLSTPNIDDILQAIEIAVSGGGHTLGDDVYLGFRGSKTATSKFWKNLLDSSSVISYIEDPIPFEDLTGYQELLEKAGENTIISMGKGLSSKSERISLSLPCKAIVIRPPQVGTLTNTTEVLSHVEKASKITILSTSERETHDTWICDLAVAANVSYIQLGPVAKGEYVAKINRLFEITRELEKNVIEEVEE